MKVLALLTPFIVADELDPADYGYVVGCNNDSTGVVEMTVCLKELAYDRRVAPDRFTANEAGDGKCSTFTVDEIKDSAEVDADNNMILTTSVELSGVSFFGGKNFKVTPDMQVEYKCKYSLNTQTVESDSVTVEDKPDVEIELDDVGTGTLSYALSFPDDISNLIIGDALNFDITPTTSGLVHARPSGCTVKGPAEGNAMPILSHDGQPYCLNNHVGFQVVSGFGGTEGQSFKYNVFLWSESETGDAPATEEQTVECQIELSLGAFETDPEPTYCTFD